MDWSSLAIPIAPDALRDRIRRIEEGTVGGGENPSRDTARASTGIVDIDRTLGGGLEVGAIHEVVGHLDDGADGGRGPWSPPIGWLTHLALAASPTRWIVWIGAEIAPYGQTLVQHEGSLDRSVFVDARTSAERLWSADVALRSGGGGVGCVVVDATRLDMGATRRLQLAAKREKSMALLARPPDEVGGLSVASTRWAVRRGAPQGGAMDPRWIVELLRCKGVQPERDAQRSWAIEWRCATCDVGMAANMVERPDRAPAEPRESVRIITA